MEDDTSSRSVSSKSSRLFMESELPHFDKAGWLLKRGKLGRRWVKRWCELSSCYQSFTYSHPEADQEARRMQSRHILAGTVTGAVALADPLWYGPVLVYGLTVWNSRGQQRTLYCENPAERNSWVWFLSKFVHEAVHIADRYQVQLTQLLGSGAFADVVKGWDLHSGEPVAVKAVSSHAWRHHRDSVTREVAVMRRVSRHPHLLPLREVFFSEGRAYIVTDFLAGGDLHAAGGDGPCSEVEASRVVRQLLEALAHLHGQGIAHCDVKPENVLLSSRDLLCGSVKLIDYNYAVFKHERMAPGGTPEYIAPELLQNDVSEAGTAPKLDIWAVGVLTYWLLCGRTPFAADSIPGVLLNILNGSFQWPKEVHFSAAARSLIGQLLRRQPQERPTAQQALQHPWFAGEGPTKKACGKPWIPLGVRCSVPQLRVKPSKKKQTSGATSLLQSCSPASLRIASTAPGVGDRMASGTATCELERSRRQSVESGVSTISMLPSNLSIKVMPPSPRAPDGEPDSPEPCNEEIAEEDGTFVIEGTTIQLVPYEEGEEHKSAEEDERDPLDSCMSIHQNREFPSKAGGEQTPPSCRPLDVEPFERQHWEAIATGSV